jgi:hypothetical protein
MKVWLVEIVAESGSAEVVAICANEEVASMAERLAHGRIEDEQRLTPRPALRSVRVTTHHL